MYVPEVMKMHEQEKIYQCIEENGFALLVSASLTASHLPFLLERNKGPLGSLFFHMAKANPHWQELEGQPVLVSFQGPHSYISPTWYKTPQAVPTWNYVAVHCYGVVERLSDTELNRMIQEMVDYYEPSLKTNSEIMPERFRQQKLAGIVGFRLTIEKLDAKQKLGQHRSGEDQKGTLNALKRSDNPTAMALAQYMIKNAIGTGE